MRLSHSFFLLLSVLSLSITGCETNEAPVFDSIVPSDGYAVEQGETIEFYFGASDPDGEVVSMSLKIDGTTVITVSSDYIDYDWDPGSKEAGQYKVTVTAVDDLGKAAETSIQITLDPVTVNTPSNVHAAPYEGRIFVSWDMKVDFTGVGFADSYNLYWTDDGSEPDEHKNVITGITIEYFNHEDLDHTKLYKYRVQSLRKGFTSDLSATVSATPKPGAPDTPENLGISMNDRTAVLGWDPVSGSGITYEVKRKCVPVDGYFKTVAEDLSSPSFSDADLSPGQGFFYKVVAYDPSSQRSSEESETVYGATLREVFEHERNNEDCKTSLLYDTHYWDAEELTEELDWFSIQGGYTGTYSIYSAASYKNYDADCFLLWLEDGDEVEFKLISGNMSGLWSMSAKVIEYGKNSSNNDREVICHEFSESGDSFVYDQSNTGSVFGCYLNISMWDELINYGPYSYEVEIKIVRQP